uniref:Uncharacterized protein n=1 Tax=Lepeophtheirus salmonis TaxID=72036 RepID=A0A0K2V6V6_LEPSM
MQGKHFFFVDQCYEYFNHYLEVGLITFPTPGIYDEGSTINCIPVLLENEHNFSKPISSFILDFFDLRIIKH